MDQQPNRNSETTLLDELNRSDNQLASLDDLKPLLHKHLKSLDLSINLLAGFEFSLPSLVNLNLSSNRLKDIKCFKGLNLLAYLDVSLNLISNIEGAELPNLRSLNLNYNQLTSIKGVEKLRNIVELRAEDNKLTNISFSSMNFKVTMASQARGAFSIQKSDQRSEDNRCVAARESCRN
jgi:Leucine-rich repeat (LRR) protein